MISLLIVGLVYFIGGSRAMKCNGMEELCDLRFDQVTLAGTHNSASNKAMYYGDLAETRAASCSYQNQDKTIYQQLKDGIRALDIDICFRYEYDDKVWACHQKAYIEPVKNVFKEIAKFMNEPENRNEVLFIRLHDADLTEYSSLKKELETAFNKNSGVEMDDTKPTYPKLRDAIKSNKRIFLFIATKVCDFECQDQHPYLRSVNDYHDTWDTWWSGSCHKMAAWTKDRCAGFRKGWHKPLTYVSVFGTWGACNTLVATTCNQYIKDSALNCHQEMDKGGQTVNVIAVDYYTRSQSVIEIAKQMNRLNIKNYSAR